VYLDEAANFLARSIAAALFLLVIALAARARLPPVRQAEATFGAFLLLTPTLHPWYVLWVVPLIPLGASRAWLALAASAPLGYWPLAAYRAGAPWRDPTWTRAIEHGATWLLLTASLWRARRSGSGGERAH
jgi:hypothetical protein